MSLYCSKAQSEMDNLWKKESNGAKAQYVDLFAHLDDEQKEDLIDEFTKLSTTSAGHKDNQSSRTFRQRGDDFFRDENWSEAMDSCNKSLRFADESENVSIVYFNRSSCFFNMKMYEKALVDAERVMSSNAPTHLIPKLDQCKQRCRERVDNIKQPPEWVPTLSYEANENHPCLANVIDIKYNREFGRHLVATANIPIGRTVLVTKSFATIVTAEKQAYCHTCQKIKMNFIPCKNCSDVMFCDEDCANKDNLHKMECQTCYHQIDDTRLKLVVQTILVAIDMLPNIESLITFVDEVTRDKGCDTIPKTSCDAPSKYGIFLTLIPTFKEKNMIWLAYQAFTCINLMPKVKQMFDTEAKQRFLMHLVLQHTIVIPKNAFNTEVEDQYTTYDIYDVLSIANHSCSPNLDCYNSGKIDYCETVRPIEKGDQLFISYLGGEVLESTSQRRKYLKKNWGFDCKCDKCEPNVSKSHRTT
ncbi:SET and MYND domain-containing protein 4-like [Sitodiplosis mosellana]|uniref:SET and MYND domain-containing protein 4-like n=1 Tax=Sitodiplosis mosellana TaxID=263140 RepID=UPI0024441FE8|nr:SET and MYND domain-containing protein 4-like [Sitodiplosis mosellana]